MHIVIILMIVIAERCDFYLNSETTNKNTYRKKCILDATLHAGVLPRLCFMPFALKKRSSFLLVIPQHPLPIWRTGRDLVCGKWVVGVIGPASSAALYTRPTTKVNTPPAN